MSHQNIKFLYFIYYNYNIISINVNYIVLQLKKYSLYFILIHDLDALRKSGKWKEIHKGFKHVFPRIIVFIITSITKKH